MGRRLEVHSLESVLDGVTRIETSKVPVSSVPGRESSREGMSGQNTFRQGHEVGRG